MKTLPIKEFTKHRCGDLQMYDQVSLVVISLYKESYSIRRLYDKVFIENQLLHSDKVSETDFNAAYVLVMSHVQIYKLS